MRSWHALAQHLLAQLRRRQAHKGLAAASCSAALHEPPPDGAATGAEAAARWHDAAHACVPPGARAHRPRLDSPVLGAAQRQLPFPRYAPPVPAAFVRSRACGVRCLLTPAFAGLGQASRCWCTVLACLTRRWACQTRPSAPRSAASMPPSRSILVRGSGCRPASTLRDAASPRQGTPPSTGQRRHSSARTRRYGGCGTASAWCTCCFWRSYSFSRQRAHAAS